MALEYMVMQAAVPDWLQEAVAGIVAFLPRLVGALVVLLVGWIVGRVVAGVVRRLADAVEIDRMVLGTPIGRMLGGTERAVSDTFGTLAAWFVYAVAIVAAADALAIPVLSQWVATAVAYLPAFVAGLLVIVLGFVVADFIGDAIMRTQAATESSYTSMFATGVKFFLYFMAITIGLQTMGIAVGILYVFARAAAWGLAAAIAIGVGIALGWGGHTYVAENIGRWMGQVQQAAPEPRSETDTGTGPTPGDD